MLGKFYKTMLKYTYGDILLLTSVCFVVYLIGHTEYLLATDIHLGNPTAIIKQDIEYNFLLCVGEWLVSSAILSMILLFLKKKDIKNKKK